MTPETLAALRGSIEKWDKIAAQEGVDQGSLNCPLCKLFATRHPICTGCPVADKTGFAGCDLTPYRNFYRLKPQVAGKLGGYRASTPEQIDAARAMADFLRNLLPEDES